MTEAPVLMARGPALAMLLIAVLAACDRSAQDEVPDSSEWGATEASESVLFWAEGREVATGAWPEPAYRGELDSPVTAIEVINGQLLAASENGVIRRLTPLQVAVGGRLAPTRNLQPGCRVEAMAGRDHQLWVLYRGCEHQSLHIAEIRLPALSLVVWHELEPDHGGPVAMAVGDEYLFVLRSDPFELTRLRLSDLRPDGRVDLLQDARPTYGFGELLFVDGMLWVIDRYSDRLIQVRPQGPSIDFSRTFASLGLAGAIGGCRVAEASVYCLAGSSVYALDAGSLKARLLYTAQSRLQSLLVDGSSLLIGDSDRTLRLHLHSGTVDVLANHPAPKLIGRLP